MSARRRRNDLWTEIHQQRQRRGAEKMSTTARWMLAGGRLTVKLMRCNGDRWAAHTTCRMTDWLNVPQSYHRPDGPSYSSVANQYTSLKHLWRRFDERNRRRNVRQRWSIARHFRKPDVLHKSGKRCKMKWWSAYRETESCTSRRLLLIVTIAAVVWWIFTTECSDDGDPKHRRRLYMTYV